MLCEGEQKKFASSKANVMPVLLASRSCHSSLKNFDLSLSWFCFSVQSHLFND